MDAVKPQGWLHSQGRLQGAVWLHGAVPRCSLLCDLGLQLLAGYLIPSSRSPEVRAMTAPFRSRFQCFFCPKMDLLQNIRLLEKLLCSLLLWALLLGSLFRNSWSSAISLLEVPNESCFRRCTAVECSVLLSTP